jgi:hypothetical protein
MIMRIESNKACVSSSVNFALEWILIRREGCDDAYVADTIAVSAVDIAGVDSSIVTTKEEANDEANEEVVWLGIPAQR